LTWLSRPTQATPAPRNGAEENARAAEMMARVRRLELATRRLVESLFAGQYHSAFKGRGLEFSEVREYDPADDHRLIDWNVTARTGSLHVRKYAEERELTTFLVVDLSGSQRFGTATTVKRELAAHVCALVAFSALRNNDKVGSMLFTDRIESFLAPRKGRDHALRLVRDALFLEPEGRGTDLAGALAFMSRAVKRRAVVFVVSDFIAGSYERELRIAALRHDVICVAVSDPWEASVPRGLGLVPVRDPETGAEFLLDTDSRRVVERYARDRANRAPDLQRRLSSCGADAVALSTREDIVAPLARFFGLRGHGRRRRRR